MANFSTGRLSTAVGKTEKITIQLTSDDGASFPATVYTGVNVTTDPELRDALIDGSLNRVESPFDDQRTYHPAVPVTYHNEEQELFALVIPEALRHEEYQCRAALLEQLAGHEDVLPGYMRQFEVVFDPARLQELESRRDDDVDQKQTGEDVEAVEKVREKLEAKLTDKDDELQKLKEQLQQMEQQLQEQQQSAVADQDDELQERADSLDEKAQQLDERAEQLDIREQQLQEVADRVERDSGRVDQARQKLEQERAELEHWQQKLDDRARKLQVRELNLEQQQLQREQDGVAPVNSPKKEATQVVTDDQFIEIVETGDSEGTGGRVDAPASGNRPEPTTATMLPWEPNDAFDRFDDVAGDGDDWFVERTDDLVMIGFAVDADAAQTFQQLSPAFLFQVHEIEGVPLISLTLAAFDDDDECARAVAAVLGGQSDEEQKILDDIARQLHVHIAVYDRDSGQAVTAWEAGAPIRDNIKWARRRLQQWQTEDGDSAKLKKAMEAFDAGDVELVGSMRHPFDANSFIDFGGAADVKLAAGIVDYWSQPEQFHYLIGNRSFSLQSFRQIQQRVVRQALHWGVAPGKHLGQVALEQSIVSDENSLVERLLSNFAELCVGLRPNDLDPIEQWENWDALIALADDHDITPDPEVLELAEVSLKRAEEFEAAHDAGAAAEAPNTSGGSAKAATIDVAASTVSRRSKDSQITYFVPESAGEDAFDDLMEATRQELEEALDDDNRRLEATQVLVQRWGPETVDLVLVAAEEMNQPQLAALARFVEARADGLEAALMRELDAIGTGGAFVAARALAAIESTAAIPRLLDLVTSPQFKGQTAPIAECLALFGDKLIPALAGELKESPDDDALLEVLAAVERVRPGTIDELSEDRNQQVQKAAARAREKG